MTEEEASTLCQYEREALANLDENDEAEAFTLSVLKDLARTRLMYRQECAGMMSLHEEITHLRSDRKRMADDMVNLRVRLNRALKAADAREILLQHYMDGTTCVDTIKARHEAAQWYNEAKGDHP